MGGCGDEDLCEMVMDVLRVRICDREDFLARG